MKVIEKREVREEKKEERLEKREAKKEARETKKTVQDADFVKEAEAIKEASQK